MRIFHFGSLRQYEGGFVGDWAFHVDCPWRFDRADGTIVTGRDDFLEPLNDDSDWDAWDPDTDGNVQDVKMGTVAPSIDAAGQIRCESDLLYVAAVATSVVGDCVITFADGARLVVFPSGSVGEMWRLFEPGVDTSHFVMLANEIEPDE